MQRSIVISVVVGSVLGLGCSGSDTGGDAQSADTAADPATEGVDGGSESQTAHLPFGGDACQSLTASDIQSTGYTMSASRTVAGLGGPHSMCVYTLAGPARNSEVLVDYIARQFYLDSNDFGAESRTYLEGIGDGAYLTTGSELWSLTFRDGVYTVQLSERRDDGTKDRLQKFAAALAGRLE